VNLSPLNKRIDAVEQAVRAIKIPKSAKVSLTPLELRLEKIEQKLTALGRTSTRSVPAPAAKKKVVRKKKVAAPKKKAAGPRLLRSASHGRKDDLKRISGVGPKLERLLNRNGVYYFWQVSEWSAKDIKIVDEKLDVFKGRIARDKWVRQARSLKKLAGSAVAPKR